MDIFSRDKPELLLEELVEEERTDEPELIVLLPRVVTYSPEREIFRPPPIELL